MTIQKSFRGNSEETSIIFVLEIITSNKIKDTDLIPRQLDFLVEKFLDDFINSRDPQLKRTVTKFLKKI